MYSLGIKWGDARKNPVKQIEFLEEPLGRTRFLTNEEINNLIDVAGVHIKPIIVIALNTGMRLGEILNLTWNQIYIANTVDPFIEIDKSKNNNKRFIHLNDPVISLLNSLPKVPEFVFLGTRGKPLKSVKKPFKRALRMAKITNFRFHDLRHTFASYYLMSGGDLLSLKEILGHKSLKMVERYAHLASKYKRKMLNNLTFQLH